MPRYLNLSMPRDEAEQLRHLVIAGMPQFVEPDHPRNLRILARLDAALKGKTLAARNRHNTPRAKGDTKTADEMLRQARGKWS